MSKDFCKDVSSFTDKFKLVRRAPGSKIDPDLLAFRVKFLAEELDEIQTAIERKDLAQLLDGLVDLTYVAIGTADLLGLNFPLAWDLVHQANMQKVRVDNAENSKRKSAFDIVKPIGWTAPKIDSVIKEDSEKAFSGEFQLDLVEYIESLQEKK